VGTELGDQRLDPVGAAFHIELEPLDGSVVRGRCAPLVRWCGRGALMELLGNGGR
jgi:hypothetical protein